MIVQTNEDEDKKSIISKIYVFREICGDGGSLKKLTLMMK